MKISFVSPFIAVVTVTLLAGCAWQVGGDKKFEQPTIGQQLIDLQKAKDTGAISDREYQIERTRVLNHGQ